MFAYTSWLFWGVGLVPFRTLHVCSLNSSASKYWYKFSRWSFVLKMSKGNPSFEIIALCCFVSVDWGTVPAHSLCVDSAESSFGCLWTPWRQYDLGDPLVRHDWFGKRYYCATSRRWPGGSTSESGKDPVTASQLTIRSPQLERKAWLYYWSGGGIKRRLRNWRTKEMNKRSCDRWNEVWSVKNQVVLRSGVCIARIHET